MDDETTHSTRPTKYGVEPYKLKATYRLIKKYEKFVLLERADLGYKECFTYREYKKLKVVNRS